MRACVGREERRKEEEEEDDVVSEENGHEMLPKRCRQRSMW
jgi:hypothetical protein